jgi:hypothetical protein
MKRRELDHGDSFDLFLDTICNTFGGVVFLAILVALLAKIRHDPAGTETAEKPVTAVMMRTLELELAEQQSRLEALRSVLTAIPEPTIESTVAELVDRSEELKSLATMEDQLVKQRQQLGEKLIQLATEAAEIPAGVEKKEDELEEVNVQLATAKAEWEVVRKQKSKTMQVPLERQGEGARGMILLSGGELFLISSPDYEQSKFFDKHVLSEPIPDSNGYEVTPRFGKGIALGSEKSIIAIRETAHRLSRSDSTLIIVVYPDTYHHFAPVRDAFKSFGMNYELWIQDKDDSLKVFFGDGRGRVQ